MIFHHWNLCPRSSVSTGDRSASFVNDFASRFITPHRSFMKTDGDSFFSESYAQVATSVIQPVLQRSSCELKLDGEAEKKSVIRSVRFQAGELSIVRAKARMTDVSINSYIRASALGSNYKQPINPELERLLLATNRELTAQGNNLNQIAKHLHMGKLSLAQAASLLESIRTPLVATLRVVKNALVEGPSKV